MPRVTLKLCPHETGLASVGAGPRGWHIRVDGKEVGAVSAAGGGWRPMQGWYFYARDESLGIPLKNTASQLVSTPEIAKQIAIDYVKGCLARAAEVKP